MKKWAAIFLLCLYAFCATDACQILKLPFLLEHYREHKQENSDLGFISFMQLHYSGEIKIDADFEKDMQLPFKKHESDCCLSIVTILPARIETSLKSPENIPLNYPSINVSVHEPGIAQSVFQPPRV